MPGGNPADGTSKNVIEHQCGNAEFRQAAAEGLLYGAVDSAAHEHAAALHVHGAHGVGEQHDGKNEPGSGLANVAFRFATGIIGGRSKVVKDDSGGAPEGDEAQQRGCRDENARDTALPWLPCATGVLGVLLIYRVYDLRSSMLASFVRSSPASEDRAGLSTTQSIVALERCFAFSCLDAVDST